MYPILLETLSQVRMRLRMDKMSFAMVNVERS